MSVEHFTEPPDRLARLADAAMRTVESHPEALDGDLAVVLLVNPETVEAIISNNYGHDQQLDAVADLMKHVAAMLDSIRHR